VDDLTLLYDIMLCVNIARSEEPLPEHEIAAIVQSVAQTHLKALRHEQLLRGSAGRA
jgi:hypothetical protein